jgi:hypothetical protein
VVRAVVRIGLMLAVNAVALIVASIFLHGFGINVTGFLIALVIFTASVAVLTPLFVSRLEDRSGIALVGVALAATLVRTIVQRRAAVVEVATPAPAPSPSTVPAEIVQFDAVTPAPSSGGGIIHGPPPPHADEADGVRGEEAPDDDPDVVDSSRRVVS